MSLEKVSAERSFSIWDEDILGNGAGFEHVRLWVMGIARAPVFCGIRYCNLFGELGVKIFQYGQVIRF